MYNSGMNYSPYPRLSFAHRWVGRTRRFNFIVTITLALGLARTFLQHHKSFNVLQILKGWSPLPVLLEDTISLKPFMV